MIIRSNPSEVCAFLRKVNKDIGYLGNDHLGPNTEIPQEWLDFNHIENCRIAKALADCYPEIGAEFVESAIADACYHLFGFEKHFSG